MLAARYKASKVIEYGDTTRTSGISSTRRSPPEDASGMLSDSQDRLWLGYLNNPLVERAKEGLFRTLQLDGKHLGNTLTFSEAAGPFGQQVQMESVSSTANDSDEFSL
jgi:hypothetical protein